MKCVKIAVAIILHAQNDFAFHKTVITMKLFFLITFHVAMQQLNMASSSIYFKA